MPERSYDDVIAEAERRGLRPDPSYLAPKYDYIRLTARAMNLELGETVVLTFEANGDVQPGTFIVKCVSDAPTTRSISAASKHGAGTGASRFEITVVEQGGKRSRPRPSRAPRRR